jgi:hypothetical protein
LEWHHWGFRFFCCCRRPRRCGEGGVASSVEGGAWPFFLYPAADAGGGRRHQR